MPLKPVDFQLLVPRATEVARNNSNLQFKNNEFTAAQAASTNKQAELETKTVSQKENTQQAAIHKDGSSNRNHLFEQGKRKKKKGTKQTGNESNIKKQINTIDIRL